MRVGGPRREFSGEGFIEENSLKEAVSVLRGIFWSKWSKWSKVHIIRVVNTIQQSGI